MPSQQKRKAPDEADVAATAPAARPKPNPESGLFANCRPFLLPMATPNRPTVAAKIVANGGRVTNERSKEVLVLMPENVPAKSDTFKNDRCLVKISWLWQSLERNQILPTQDYALDGSIARVWPAEEGEAEDTVDEDVETPVACPGLGLPRPEGGRSGGRMHFTEAEDEALRKWVLTHGHMPAQGKRIWELAERARITRHGWASMQNRWRRHARYKGRIPRSEHIRAAGAPAPAAAAASLTKSEASTAAGSPSALRSGAERGAGGGQLQRCRGKLQQRQGRVQCESICKKQGPSSSSSISFLTIPASSSKVATTTTTATATATGTPATTTAAAAAAAAAPAASASSCKAATATATATATSASSSSSHAATGSGTSKQQQQQQQQQRQKQRGGGSHKDAPAPQQFSFASFIGGKSKLQLQLESMKLRKPQQQQQQQQQEEDEDGGQQQQQQQQQQPQQHPQEPSPQVPQVEVVEATIQSSNEEVPAAQEYYTPEEHAQEEDPADGEALDAKAEETWQELFRQVLGIAPMWIQENAGKQVDLKLF